MSIPGFNAEKSLEKSRENYRQRVVDSYSLNRESVVSPAFRVTCGTDIALGALCTGLGAGSAFFPCFWNSGCMWVHAGLAFPPCFGCTFV